MITVCIVPRSDIDASVRSLIGPLSQKSTKSLLEIVSIAADCLLLSIIRGIKGERKLFFGSEHVLFFTSFMKNKNILNSLFTYKRFVSIKLAVEYQPKKLFLYKPRFLLEECALMYTLTLLSCGVKDSLKEKKRKRSLHLKRKSKIKISSFDSICLYSIHKS